MSQVRSNDGTTIAYSRSGKPKKWNVRELE
jgi:hypothetical protein